MVRSALTNKGVKDMAAVLWVLGTFLILAAIVSPLNFFIGGTSGVILIAIGFVIKNKNKDT